MVKCKFCQRTFRSPQAVRAHLKHCPHYQTVKSKRSAASGSLPQACSPPTESPPIPSSHPHAAPALTAPLDDLVKAMHEFSTKRDAPQTSQQQHRTILESAKVQVIDRYSTSLGLITPAMCGAAKLAIEQKLAPLPLVELGLEQVCAFGIAIRDPLYAIAFTTQAREAEHQRVEARTREKQELEAWGALVRTERRKKRFMQLADQQAHARCRSKGIKGLDHVAILSDVRTSLEDFLDGSEPVLAAYAIIQTALDAKFVEVDATLAADRAKTNAQWREEVEVVLVLGVVVGLVMLSLHYPAQTVAIFNWLERIFKYTPGAETAAPNPEAAETASSAANAEARPRSTRRRKYPVALSNHESPCTTFVGPAQGHA